MKSLVDIFKEQFRTKEIWMRVWELSRFKKYENFKEWKKASSRVLTREDVPALTISTLIGVAIVVLMSNFFKGRTLMYALLGAMAICRILQRVVDSYLKRKQNDKQKAIQFGDPE